MFGAQRLALSDGLAVPRGEVDAGVSSGLGWASGDLGLFSSSKMPTSPTPPDGIWRQLNEVASGDEGSGNTTAPTPAAYDALTERLCSLGIALLGVSALNLASIWYWRTRRNRAFYDELMKKRQRSTSFRHLSDNEQADEVRRQFHSFPGALAVPG